MLITDILTEIDLRLGIRNSDWFIGLNEVIRQRRKVIDMPTVLVS